MPSPPPLPSPRCRSPWHHLIRLRQGKSLGITLYTCLIFALASTFFLAKLVRDHKELQRRGWNVDIASTLCDPGRFRRELDMAG